MFLNKKPVAWTGFLFFTYAGWIASVGQTSAHAPQSVQASASIT
jgi:hypothetical protein